MTGQGAPGGGGGGAQHIPVRAEAGREFFGAGHRWHHQVAMVGSGQMAEIVASYGERGQAQTRREWRIERQFGARHPAWSAQEGFPADGTNPDALPRTLLWLAETADNGFYAGLIDAGREANLPRRLRELAQNLQGRETAVTIQFNAQGSSELMRLAQHILNGTRLKPCVLVYGPPGTGKTLALQQLRSFLEAPGNFAEIALDPSNPDRPFREAAAGPAFPGNVRVWWTTFHQGTTYEDFVLGLRPKPNQTGGLSLEPRAGPLLEALEHARGGNTAVIFVDEINRGHVSRIFGDFITFMEWDKRLRRDGAPDPIRTVPLRFPLLDKDPAADQSAPISFCNGTHQNLPWPYTVPASVYLIATMNSLDRSIAPLDAALARRFRRVEAKVDYAALREQLSTHPNIAHADLAIGVLKWVNLQLANTFGDDFQMGQAYMWEAKGNTPESALAALASAWDGDILPQLREICRSRPEQLAQILRLDAAPDQWPYRQKDDGQGVALDKTVPISELTPERQQAFFSRLANIEHEPPGETGGPPAPR